MAGFLHLQRDGLVPLEPGTLLRVDVEDPEVQRIGGGRAIDAGRLAELVKDAGIPHKIGPRRRKLPNGGDSDVVWIKLDLYSLIVTSLRHGCDPEELIREITAGMTQEKGAPPQ